MHDVRRAGRERSVYGVSASAEGRSTSVGGGRARLGGVRRIFASALFLVVGVPLLLLPWLAHRVLFVNPLAAPTSKGSGWIRRDRRDEVPGSPSARDCTASKLPLHHRVRRASTIPLLVVAVALSASALAAARRSEDPPPVSAAFDGADWWPEYEKTIGWFDYNAFNPLRQPRLADFRSPYINVEGGHRRTWRPPPCECRRLSVWIYGGSTTFGIGQRDDHTIASELARLAWDRGYALDVVNKGTPGAVNWVNAVRFGWEVEQQRPDIVLFYDGFNDISAVRAFPDRAENGPVDFPTATLDSHLTQIRSVIDRFVAPERPPGARLVATGPAPPQSASRAAALAVRYYEHGRDLARRAAEPRGTVVRWFWQPVQSDRPPVPGEPEHGDREGEERVRRIARALLPADVVDLSDLFDAYPDRPIFADTNHTNEEGARMVAAAILESIQPDVAALAGPSATTARDLRALHHPGD